MAFFGSTNNPASKAKQVIHLCGRLEALLERATASVSKQNVPDLAEKMQVMFDELSNTQAELAASKEELESLSDELRNDMKGSLKRLEASFEKNLIGLQIDLNVNNILLEVAKQNAEEQAKLVAGYNEKGKYSATKSQLRDGMVPLVRPQDA